MHRALTARWLNRALRIGEKSHAPGVLAVLCPAFGRSSSFGGQRISSPTIGHQCHLSHVHAIDAVQDASAIPTPNESPSTPTRKLPLTCSGCGAFTQTSDPNEFGYYNQSAKRVKQWMHPKKREATLEQMEENNVVGDVLSSMDPSKLEALGISADSMIAPEAAETDAPEKPPICDRCHNLLYYNMSGESAKIPMHHPTVESLRDTIDESPHKYNHIYHVIDAADFPMSLIPRLNVLLGDVTLRSRNRRHRGAKYHHNRQTEMSFIITRSDLLAPTKEMVDAMMPYLREVLRESLGRIGGRVRLGGLKCVSAKRGWWTKDLKEDVWERGGGGWMVGKVNVGKSQLFEAVFPKGRVSDAAGEKSTSVSLFPREDAGAESIPGESAEDENWDETDLGDLLPPAQPATDYPTMPLVSSLPGTTASPIRIPFGKGKGELIDLPGLARSDLDLFVKEEHRQSLIMKQRIVPEQISVKSGQSLLLGGGLIRITPRTSDLIFLMYNFTPIKEHLTMTEKAIGFQDQTRESMGLENITLPGIGDKMKLAGTFQLRHDVTKERAGVLTRRNGVGLQVDRLPFRVLSVDILIEGVGYVEIVAQVRARDMERLHSPAPVNDRPRSIRERIAGDDQSMSIQERIAGNDRSKSIQERIAGNDRSRSIQERIAGDVKASDKISGWPAVDVFTPEGRFVGSRRPIQGWLNNKRRVLAIHKKTRPRKSMKGEKKKAKQERRANEGAPQ